LVIAQGSGGGNSNNTNREKNETEFELNENVEDSEFYQSFESFLDDISTDELFADLPDKLVNRFLLTAVFGGAFLVLIAAGLKIFIFNPLIVGCQKFFVTSAEEPHKNMSFLGFAYEKGNYLLVVKTMFLKGLYLFLWFLLLIIPGIIKTYAYRMVPFILADNPQMDTNEVIKLSRDMMNGQKMSVFVLDISFIGWYLLGALAMGIGVFFVNPYAFSTNAQLYLVLRDKAINEHIISRDQLFLA
jgi:uncharacterized membrane protein